ncbi:MAG: class I SAM-dependent methyltransferase [Blastocatellales bacterium]|nr:class I SAM-dependent methyltransferase [Blastocatellales bacterium]
MSEIFTDYDRFAWFYNRYWGEEFSLPVLGIFEKILFPDLPGGARILDLCCGTGQLASGLVARGYRVTGVDGSESMLAFAKTNAPDADFVCADARTFSLPALFDAAVSTFDSLNHILALDELVSVFRRVRAALRPSGRFVFDMNMESEFETGGLESRYDIVEADHACSVRSSYDKSSRLKRYDVKIYRRERGEWDREELVLMQRYYLESEVAAALVEAGFGSVEVLDAEHEFDLSISDGRAFFLAR